MSRRLARVLSIGALVLCVTSFVAAGILHTTALEKVPPGKIVVVGDPTAPRMQGVLEDLDRAVARGDSFAGTEGGEFWPFLLLILLFILLWLGTGVLIVSRRPTNWAGWLFVITGAPFPLLSLAQALMIYGLKAEPGSVPLIGIWAAIGEYALYPVALIPLLFLLYPDGHVPSRGWRWAAIALVGGTTLAFLGFLFRPGPFNNWVEDGIVFENPLGVRGYTWGGTVIRIGTIAALAAALSTVLAVWQRFKRSTGEERQQMRILVFVASLAGAFVALMLVLITLGTVFNLDERNDGGDWIFGLGLALTAFTIVVGIPVAYLVAIFRYRLWDLDVVIKKTVVFGVVAAGVTLVAVLLVLVLPLGVIGTGLSGWEWGLLSIGAVIGLLFGPLRRVARRIADRIVYRKRATPYEVLTAFSEKVGETYSTEDVLPRMVQLLVRGTGATSARVLLRIGADVREVARWPDEVQPIGDEYSVPVTHLGEELGALVVRMPANDPMDPTKEKLVADLAAQTGLVLRNVRLIEELRASRRRIVEAQDDRAKKLERNIHDGAQQQLVALQVKLRLAEQMADRDASKAKELLGQLQSETGQALEDLRDLARGIYPPLLADKGLASALEAQARRSPVPVLVEPDGVGRLSREVESTVYFCVLEALQNMAKYAHASRATVTLSQEDGGLSFSVADDGRGFDPDSTRYGTGMQGMSDRLDAIGGTLEVRSVPGAGTTVTGRVPGEAAR